MSFKVNTSRVNETVHRAVVDDADLRALVAQAVADGIGDRLKDAASCRSTGRRDTSTGFESQATVEIIQVHGEGVDGQ